MKRCAITDCLRERLPDSLYCRLHTADSWANRLPESEWVRRARANQLPPKRLAA